MVKVILGKRQKFVAVFEIHNRGAGDLSDFSIDGYPVMINDKPVLFIHKDWILHKDRNLKTPTQIAYNESREWRVSEYHSGMGCCRALRSAS